MANHLGIFYGPIACLLERSGYGLADNFFSVINIPNALFVHFYFLSLMIWCPAAVGLPLGVGYRGYWRKIRIAVTIEVL